MYVTKCVSRLGKNKFSIICFLFLFLTIFHLKDYFRTPMQIVSSVFVDHMRAVESSEPVTSMLPSSERAMQLMDSSWSPRVSFNDPLRLLVELPFPIFWKQPFGGKKHIWFIKLNLAFYSLLQIADPTTYFFRQQFPWSKKLLRKQIVSVQNLNI